MKKKIIVVGGIAAGPSAAAKAVRTSPNSDVVLFEATDTVSYGICETPYVIGGTIEDENKLLVYTPQRLQEEKGFTVRTLHHVESIHPAHHEIVVRDLRQRSELRIEYDKLILATGASPKRLGLEGETARNVFFLRSREDCLAILQFMKSETVKQAIIIGAGYIGMEMAEAFSNRGLEVAVIDQGDMPLDRHEQNTREKILETLWSHNVTFQGGIRVEGFVKDSSGKVRHIITNRGSFECDMVLIAVGITPNTSLAKSIKIRTGNSGAILTNEQQQTSIDDIYAAGDCSEVKNIVTNLPAYIPLASVASRTGWIAGENAAGGRASFKGALRSVALKVFDMEIGHVGLSSEEALEHRFDVTTETITSKSKIPFYPGSEDLTITLILDRRTQRVLGADVFGKQGAVLRSNILGVAIQQKLTVSEVSQIDLSYAPPFSPLWDPVLVAANKSKRKII
jgi:CoA-dependent NAD(P)H sulfur oxidoreductase